MLLEVGELAEGLGALLALVWLLPAVDPLVYLQISSSNGGEAALVTPVESLTSVFRHVDIQCTGIST